MHPIARLDQAHVWHPFTQMQDWLRQEPIVLVSGRGTILHDLQGREYLDANSSIWTNLHGHRNPHLDRAIRRQLGKVAHVSALGLANEPASRLAAELVRQANPARGSVPRLSKVFFSDDGSTGMEAALKLTHEYWRRTHGPRPAPRFLSLQGAYHGDTVGAMSLGHSGPFHRPFSDLMFRSDAVMAPYCYRCPFNRAHPERQDAREYRRCGWECVGEVEQRLDRAAARGRPYAAFVYEPCLQGAAGMIPQPKGWLHRVAGLARTAGSLLVADEVMTAFGRVISPDDRLRVPLHASSAEGVQPDFVVLAKGLTGGYLPMAATLTTGAVFEAFLGEYREFKTFFHGHSYTANPLAASAALASLELLQTPVCRQARKTLSETLGRELRALWDLPAVGDIRQVGLAVGVELVRDWRRRTPFPLAEQAGIRVCQAMARRGVLTRPIGNVIVLMPPYCTTPRQARRMVEVLHESIAECHGSRAAAEAGRRPA